MNTLQTQKLMVPAFLLAFALLVLIGIGAYRQGMANLEAEKWVLHTHEVQHSLADVLSRGQDIWGATRGYVITGQESYLEPFHHALQLIPQNIQQLRRLTADNPGQQRKLDVLESLIAQRIEISKEQIALRWTRGQSAAEEVISAGEGKRVMDEIRKVVAEMSTEEGRLLQRRTGELRASNARTLSLFAVLVLALGVLLAAALFLVRREVAAKQREISLIKSARAQAQNIVDTVREPLLVLDAELRVKSANRSFYQAFHTTPQETEGVFLHDVGNGQWNIPELRKLLKEMLPSHSEIHDFLVEHEFPVIGRRTMLLNARKMFRVGNNTETILLAMEDITERKRAEDALRLAKEEAERASHFKDQFLSTMSHELRTPLNAVLGFSELLQEERYGPLNERQRRYLNHIHAGGKHLLTLINDILDLSRIEAGRMEIAMEEVAVKTAFGEVLSVLGPLAEKKSQKITQRDDGGAVVRADLTRFKQVLMNLVGNAIKFTPDGGRIELVAHAADGEVRIEVRDNGRGIPHEEQQRIFDAFYRLRRSGEPNEGTGLGLTITQRLVALQGGQLGLESEPGKGSCFFFSLPTAELREAAEKEALAVVNQEGRPRVLVIEDDVVAAKLMQAQLAESGCDVVLALQPAQAVEQAISLQPDVITLDLLMEPINGWQILLELKRDPRTAKIPVVVVTVVDQPAMGATLGADEYLVKPVEKEALLKAVRRCLAAHTRAQADGPILVVEDDQATREIIAAVLSDAGYAVAAAADGAEARQWVSASLPELVVLDLLLPKVSGFELLADWRSDPRTADVPVLVLTGKDLTPAEEAYIDEHARVLLRKQQPWREQLAREVRRLTTHAGVEST